MALQLFLPNVNYLAVLVAAIASMVVGFLWYGPVFGSQWKKLMSFTDKDIKKMKMTPKTAMILGFIAALVISCTLAHFLIYMNISSVADAVMAAFLIWIGFVATVQVGAVLWEGKPWKLFFLNAGHTLVSLAVMAVILAVWV